MAPPKKIIAPRNLADNHKQICLFYRIAKKWYLEKTLVEEIFNSNIKELKQLMEKMRELSEQLNIPWQKKAIRVKNKKVKSPSEKIPILYFDGSSYLHLKLGACAYVILLNNSTLVGNQILNKVDSTEAEYMGLIMGLKKAVELRISKINIKGDSRTVINQVKGIYKVKEDNLTYKYCQQVLELLSFFEEYTLTWIARCKNQRADRLAYKCIKNYLQQQEIN